MLVGLEAVLKGSKATKAYKNAEKALDMVDDGKDMDTVFKETGVDILSDTDAMVMEFPIKIDLSKLKKDGSTSLSEIVFNDELYEVNRGSIAANVTVNPVESAGGSFDKVRRRINLGAEFVDSNNAKVSRERITAHETQHVFQWIEGRPYGMNPSFLKSRMPEIVQSNLVSYTTRKEVWKALEALSKGDSKAVNNLAYRLYQRSPGEVEARVTEVRDTKNNPARKFIRPDKTYRVMISNDKILDQITFELLDQIRFEKQSN